MTGEPHTALTAFRRRQLLAWQGGGAAGLEDLGRPGFAFWRRAGAQRRQRAEAEAGEARLAVLEADARLAGALAAKAAAEQEAVAAREAAQARVAQAGRAAQERVAAAQQERDEAVARAELDRARQDADRRVAQVREDAARDRAGLREALEARIAAAAEARDGFQARAEHAEAELQRVRADRDQAAVQATPGATRRRRRSRGKVSGGQPPYHRTCAAANMHVVFAEVRGIFGVALDELPGAAVVPWPGPWRTPLHEAGRGIGRAGITGTGLGMQLGRPGDRRQALSIATGILARALQGDGDGVREGRVTPAGRCR